MDLIKDAPIVKVVMLKGADGAKSNISELTNDMTFLTREEITTLVNNIISSGSVGDIDTGFVTKIKELNKNKALSFWVGTQAEYNAIATKTANTFYIITDDNYKEEVAQAIAELSARVDEMQDYEIEISNLQSRTGTLESNVNSLITDVDKLNHAVYTPSKTTIQRVEFRGAGYIYEGAGDTYNITFNFPLEKYLSDRYEILTTGSFLGLTMFVMQGSHVIISSGASEATITDADIENHGLFIKITVNGAFENVTAYKTCDISAHMSFKVQEV